MAPSTAIPTDLHRASVACLQCRKAKVRCLVSQRLDRCNRCITNDSECVFAQPRRARTRTQPYPQPPRSEPSGVEDDNQDFAEELASIAPLIGEPYVASTSNEPIRARQLPTSTSQRATSVDDSQQQRTQPQQSVITNTIRARIIAALASIKGKRGAPFSFVTSGDSPSFSTRADPNEPTPRNLQRQQSFEQSQTQTPRSLKLSWLLRPLRIGSHQQSRDDDRRPPGLVKMPSYISSMTLGQTITDPIEGGMISPQASTALFEFLMVEMNAKWEYILDPHIDTPDSVQQRSSVLFTSILFCASKFANYIDGHLVSAPDQFLQSRLCSLARNLVIKSLAEGDRSVETMQALYLLVCWKDADDDISYLHSGYAFRILQDLDVGQNDGGGRQVARHRRTWLALFRQDRQQSLFFMRRASKSPGDDDISFLCDLDTWLKMPYALPSDFVACCSADLRRVQWKLRNLVKKASSIMLPCLLELMDADMCTWKAKWKDHLQGEARRQSHDDPSLNPRLLHPGTYHLNTLVHLWDHSVRLNVASAILRQALTASVTSSVDSNHPADTSLDLDLTTLQQLLSPDLPGLRSSIEAAFGTLQYLIKIPPEDLRRSPDAVLLLAPNAALFLCLFLCLPSNGILGLAFQRAAVSLIRDIAHHIGQCVKSPQDTVALYSLYLDSLVELLDPSTLQCSTEQPQLDIRSQPTFDMSHTQYGANELDLGDPTVQAAQVLADGIGTHSYNMARNDGMFSLSGDPGQNLYVQSLANLLDGDLFWEMPPAAGDVNIAS
ncbi:hypothetical protein BDW59DRAFT_178362 [Aspergillus cavernicola]|uniref:Zn(2)-C6 fungal-type domain-containing protein n=1 Tax=Aspergillus cavernicola TaxID=176166 RepID=A0ABR4HBS7_9EURO